MDNIDKCTSINVYTFTLLSVHRSTPLTTPTKCTLVINTKSKGARPSCFVKSVPSSWRNKMPVLKTDCLWKAVSSVYSRIGIDII